MVDVPSKGSGGVSTVLALAAVAGADMVGATLETGGVGCCVGVLGPVGKWVWEVEGGIGLGSEVLGVEKCSGGSGLV